MYGLFDKHGKKLLVIASMLLILVFLLPANFGRPGGNGGAVGTVNGAKVDQNEVMSTAAGLRSLENVLVPAPDRQGQGSIPTPLPSLLFGRLYDQFERDPLSYYLLVKEAQKAGAMPTEDRVREILQPKNSDNPVQFRAGGQTVEGKYLNDQVMASYTFHLSQALAVVDNFTRAQRAIKISTPMIDQALAKQAQQIKIHTAVFEASEFESQVQAPSEEALRAQFDAFAATAPGTIDEKKNPFGFGYRTPDRVRLQYVLVPNVELEKVINASKTPDQWEEDARLFYLRNPGRFQTGGGELSQSDKPATQPTTRPFNDARADVLKAVQEPLIAQRRQAILGRLTQVMGSDLQSAQKDDVKRKALSDFGYLTKLRDQIQQQFGVTISVFNEPGLMSQADVEKLPGLSAATAQGRQPGAGTSAASYLFTSLSPLAPADQQNTVGGLELLQPSPVLSGPDGSYVVRAVEAEPNHPARTLEDVRDQVVKDVRAKEAFALAAAAAEKAAKENTALSLTTLKDRKVLTSDWFGSASLQPIKGLTGLETFSAELIEPAFKILLSLQSRDQIPTRQVVPLRTIGKAVVVELFDVQNGLTKDQLAVARVRLASSLGREMVSGDIATEWFSPEAVHRRVGYTSPQQSDTPAPAPNAPRPASPFMPG